MGLNGAGSQFNLPPGAVKSRWEGLGSLVAGEDHRALGRGLFGSLGMCLGMVCHKALYQRLTTALYEVLKGQPDKTLEFRV